MDEIPLLTVKMVAERLAVREHAVLTLIRNGDLKGIDISLTPGGRPRWRINPDDLETFLARRTHQAATPTRKRRKRKAVRRYF